jgi:hypothetical protein
MKDYLAQIELSGLPLNVFYELDDDGRPCVTDVYAQGTDIIDLFDGCSALEDQLYAALHEKLAEERDEAEVERHYARHPECLAYA